VRSSSRATTTRAVADGLAKTARVLTAAATIMIMIAVFSSFALSADVVLKLMGIGMATAILVDATVVRMVPGPAIMQILGTGERVAAGLAGSPPAGPRPMPAIATD
jgi:RND superfamily putative drug exporter